MTSWTSPFQEWMNQEMVGIAASPEIMLLLAKAFDGGKRYEREACAKVCEEGVDTEHPIVKGHIMKNFGSSDHLAAAIRARSEK